MCIRDSIGAGLLGGSIGLASRARGLARRVAALVRRPESVGDCQALGIADAVTLDPTEAVTEADLIVLCTPVSGMAGLAKRILPHLKSGTVLTDVGSTKQQLVAELTPFCTETGAHFVGSHPMAGSVLDPAHGEQQAQLCSTGFRDMTRLAVGSPVMWRDIVGSNREDILAAIDEFADELGQLRGLIAADSLESIESWLQKAKAARDEWGRSAAND